MNALQKLFHKYPNVVRANGLEDAIIGIAHTVDGTILIYDAQKVIKILMDRGNMTLQEAREFYSFNIEAVYMEKRSPIFMHPLD